MSIDALTTYLAVFFGMPGWLELTIVGIVALIIFGKRLPEVGRSLGQGIVEFKKGVAGVKDELDKAEQEADKQVSDQSTSGSTTTTTAEPEPQSRG